MSMRRSYAVIFAFISFLWASANAHETRPLFIHLIESGDGVVRLSWKIPPSVPLGEAAAITITDCKVLLVAQGRQANIGQAMYSCPGDLSGHQIQIDYPLYNPSISSIVRIEFATGETHSIVLDPDQMILDIPEKVSFNSVVSRYFGLGVHHILSGIDHLLFLIGLLYIARTPARILVTITGFTLSHSLTIFLVALGALRVSIPAVEVVIALSIVFLATEIARNRRDTITWRRPIVVAASFGLVHGAGFAAALGELGLPQTERINALLFFNLGVEAGQIAVIGAIFSLAWLAHRIGIASLIKGSRQHFAQRAFSYSLGVVSAFWFVERFVNGLL